MTTRKNIKTPARRTKENARLDDWVNAITGLGDEVRDAAVNTVFARPARLDQTKLDVLFEFDPIIQIIVTEPAHDATRRWCELSADNDLAPEKMKALNRRHEQLGTVQAFKLAYMWARLFGGGAIVMAINDNIGEEEVQNKEAIPVRLNAIKRILGFQVVDRYALRVGTNKMSQEPGPDFGKPEFYDLILPGKPIKKIHRSRVLRFEGIQLPERVMQEVDYWGGSEVDLVYTAVRDFVSGMKHIPTMIKESVIDVYKISNFVQLLSANRVDDIRTRMRLQQISKSILGGIMMGEGETYDKKMASYSGMNEVFEISKAYVSAVAKMPQTKLFGQSPAGMNATGESDIRLYYDHVGTAIQVPKFNAPLAKLNQYLCLEQDGEINQDVEIKAEWHALWEMSDKEKAEIAYMDAQRDSLHIADTVVTPDEVALSRYGGDKGDIQIDEKLREEGQRLASERGTVVDPEKEEDPEIDPEIETDPESQE